MVRRKWMTLREVAEALDVSERHAHRLARPWRMGVDVVYVGGTAKEHQRYEAAKVIEYARARVSNHCAICGRPARPHATTCGNNACSCKAYRARRKAYKEAKACR